MGFISIDRDWQETARYHAEAGWTSKEFIDVYTVEMSLQSDGPEDILQACPILRTFAAHPRVVGALVLEPRFERHVGTNFWKVEIQYSTEIQPLQNPLSLPAVITDSPVPRSRIRFTDWNSIPKINSAGDLFDDPPPEVTIYDTIYKVAKNLPTIRPAWFRGYANCVNSDVVAIRGEVCEPGTLLYVPGDTGADEKGGPSQSVPFCAATFELHYRDDGWTAIVPNRGFYELVYIPATFKPRGNAVTQWVEVKGPVVPPPSIPTQLPDDQVVGKLKNGKTVLRREILIGPDRAKPTEPQFLDKLGRAIAIPTVNNIVLLEFDDHEKKPFSGILPLD